MRFFTAIVGKNTFPLPLSEHLMSNDAYFSFNFLDIVKSAECDTSLS